MKIFMLKKTTITKILLIMLFFEDNLHYRGPTIWQPLLISDAVYNVRVDSPGDGKEWELIIFVVQC